MNKTNDLTVNVEQWLQETQVRLASCSDAPALDSRILVAEVVGRPSSWVLSHPELELSPSQQITLENALVRIENGEPLPYVIGHWEFYNLDFIVTPDVLIPRPETELLVELALHWLRENPRHYPAVDIGTGSGCIAVTLASNVPDLEMVATDISLAALQVARRNAAKFGVAGRIKMIQADLLPPLAHAASPFSLICANLPYVPSETLRGLPVYQREPPLALDGGKDGLDLIRRLLDLVPQYLAAGGLVLLEIEASQGMKALSLAYDAFAEAHISLHQDLSGRDRLIRIAL